MLELKFIILLLTAASYPEITFKEDLISSIPIQNSESPTAQMKFLDSKRKNTNTQSNISEGFISKLKTIKNACVSNTISRFKEILHSIRNQAHHTYEAKDRDNANFKKIECKSHCVYDQWYRVKCVPIFVDS